MKVHFIIPEPDSFPSGGNIYNKKLIDHLPNNWVITSSDQVISRDVDWIWIDSIFLEEMPSITTSVNVGWIIHHLGSLELPVAEQDRMGNMEIKKMGSFKRCIVTSDFMKKYVLSCGLSSIDVEVIQPAISGPKLELRHPRQICEILIVSNVIPRKGILQFLQLIGQKNWDAINLSIAGSTQMDPGYFDQCLQIQENLPAMKVNFLGACSRDIIKNLYGQADLVVSPALMETFGMALQEASAFGLPVLALDRGGISEHIVSGQNGYLFDEVEALVNFLDDLISGAAVLDLPGREQTAYSWANAAEHFGDICKEL